MYDFLLVANTNLPPILHRFRDIAFDRSKIAIYLATPLAFNPSAGGVPWDDLRKFFRGRQLMVKVPNGVAFQSPDYGARALETDRQTDGRVTAYREHEREFTFAKN